MSGRSVLDWILRLALGGAMVYAGWSKLDVQEIFARNIANYRLLPAQLNQILAVTLPWVELVAGALLVLGLWTRPAAWIVAALMAAFAIGVGQALARGLDISCGCFGEGTGESLGLQTLGLEAACLAAAIAIAWLAPRRAARAPAA